jgi:hypothetical protein
VQLIHKLKPARILMEATLVLCGLPIVGKRDALPSLRLLVEILSLFDRSLWIYGKKHIWKSIPRLTAQASDINVFMLRHTKNPRTARVRFITNGCLFEIAVGGSPIEIGNSEETPPKTQIRTDLHTLS